MNIFKFLLIDLVLAFSAIPIILFIQARKNSLPLFKSFNKEKLIRKTSVKIPDKEKLIKLEKKAENHGSEIEFESLIGNWKFISVWKKDLCEEDPFFSSLLRLFSAKIKFQNELSTKNTNDYSVFSSIKFGLLTIEFSGYGCLKGRQPLLIFFLNLIELKAGSITLLKRFLKEPEEKKKSFFALIALEENNKLLSARGQRGAVVTWIKD